MRKKFLHDDMVYVLRNKQMHCCHN